MDIVLEMEKALKRKVQKRIILLLYQKEGKINTACLAKILQSPPNSISNITRRMRDKGILDYQEKKKPRFFNLTQEAIDYLHKYHPEIKPYESLTDLPDSNSKESATTNQMLRAEETIHSANNETEINPELREYYIKAIELLKLPNYMKLLINHSLKEATLLSLFIICYLENKNFNLSDIAMLFDIPENEVQTAYRKTLLMLKDKINELINNLLNDTHEVIQPNGNIIK